MPARKETRLRGRTWANRWQPINGTSNGVTVTTDETGLITVSGEVTDAGQSVSVLASEYVPVTGGASMSCIQNRTTNQSFVLNFYDADEGYLSGENIAMSATGKTFKVPDNAATTRCAMWLNPGADLTTGTFRVMLVDGDEVPDCFTAPGVTSAEPTKLATAGRNLLELGDIDVDYQGASYSVKGNTLSASGTATGTGKHTFIKQTLPPGTYSAALSGTTVTNLKNATFKKAETDNSVYIDHNSPFSAVTVDEYAFAVGAQSVGDVELVDGHLQLEPGSATDYEAPNVTETALPEGLVLRSLPDGTADELVIRQDGTAYVERHTAYVESFADEYDGENYFSSGGGLNAGDSVVYEVEQTVEWLDGITLPELPETFCEYPISDVPCRESVIYELG